MMDPLLRGSTSPSIPTTEQPLPATSTLLAAEISPPEDSVSDYPISSTAFSIALRLAVLADPTAKLSFTSGVREGQRLSVPVASMQPRTTPIIISRERSELSQGLEEMPMPAEPESAMSVDWTPRHSLIENLVKRLMENRVLHIRRTPTSRRSVLMMLLEEHFKTKYPDDKIRSLNTWPQDTSQVRSQQLLEETFGVGLIKLQQASDKILLIDEAQRPYGDLFLGIPFSSSSLLHQITDRHAGALKAIVELAQGTEGLRSLLLSGERYTVATMSKEIFGDLDVLAAQSQDFTWARGLPTAEDLEETGMQELFLQLLSEGRPTERSLSPKIRPAATNAYNSGWIRSMLHEGIYISKLYSLLVI
ncbi:hypothetical protein FN846DRAFT_894707 [Sphaerosporella brunnea]|uniref:Uncharacterized protein n=1 Tax=Sphaerosporella brunnea TaxID=1250544 RepID=A0A5J5EI75_9PEZI|nr:hypothetical protein FN846DRAFT_894707 [Sphaerosporella brunnea]